MAFPGTAIAQGRTWAGTSLVQMVESARWRMGILRVNASLSLANVGYDTDIYYGVFDEATPDYRATASLPVQVLLPLGKKAVLELNDRLDYAFYAKTERERAWNNVAGGRIHLALERLYAQAGGELSNVRYRVSPELNINVREKSDRIDGTALWQASQGVSLAVLYGYAKLAYGDPELAGLNLAEALDREETFVDLVTYSQPSTKIRLFLDGQYGTYRFTEAAARTRDTRSYGILGGLEFVPREGEVGPVEPPQGGLSLGYMRFDVLDAAVVDGSNLVGNAAFSLGVFERTTLHAFFSRDFAFSVFSDGTYFLSTAFGGGLRRRLSRKATFSYDLSFSRSAYPKAEAEGSPAAQNFRYTNHAFGLNVRLARHMGVTFQVALSQRSLGDPQAKKSRNFFGLSLVYGTPSGRLSAPVRGLA
jgi:hypothetical protein